MDTRAGAGYPQAGDRAEPEAGWEKTVTEVDWQASTDPEKMQEFLQGKASDRKLRYFLVACARRILPRSPDEDEIEVLAVAERFADGTESRNRLARARSSLKEGQPARALRWPLLYTDQISSVPAWHASRDQIVRAASEGARTCVWKSVWTSFTSFDKAAAALDFQRAAQAWLLRDMFGNPFHPVSLDSAVLTWNDAIVVRLAQAAYEERQMPGGTLDNGRLAVLADALEEAGCANADILSHCRSGGDHVRGCWVVDLVLGKS
jgi:hypothetical protein